MMPDHRVPSGLIGQIKMVTKAHHTFISHKQLSALQTKIYKYTYMDM